MEEIKEISDNWQQRLIEERTNLLDKVLKLKEFIDNEDSKCNWKEWRMLQQQHNSMTEYLRVLTERCNYYKIINTPNLDIYY